MLTGIENPPPQMFGTLMLNLPSGGYTLRRVRLSAAVRVEGAGTRAQMWLRMDRADNSMALLENMSNRPITSSNWSTYSIEANVPSDISRLALGVMLFGSGQGLGG